LTKIANVLGLIKELPEGKYKMRLEEILRYDPAVVPPTPAKKKEKA
jgi:hypothetical protein